MHTLRHYLYFGSRRAGQKAARELRDQGFETQERLGADGTNWLVLAIRPAVLSKGSLLSTSEALQHLATSLRGEYDGWEAGAESTPVSPQ